MPTATGAAIGLAGIGFVGVGLWARRDVRRALARERIAVDVAAGAGLASAGRREAGGRLCRRAARAGTP